MKDTYILPSDLHQWKENHPGITFSSNTSNGYRKKLLVTLNGHYIVTDHNIVKYDGRRIHLAVKTYNSICKRLTNNKLPSNESVRQI